MTRSIIRPPARHLATRRSLLLGGGALFAWSHVPRLAHAAGASDRRLLVVILRGGMDGLAALPPLGDPTFRDRRAQFGLSADGGTLPLDPMFALNARFSELAGLFQAGEAIAVHAAASPYRGRSHFDAQDVLEGGFGGQGVLQETGWLNRALEKVEPGAKLPPPDGLALGPVVPLIMKGKAPVETWQPRSLPTAQAEMIELLKGVYSETDPRLAAALGMGALTEKEMRNAPKPADVKKQALPGVPDFTTQAAAAAQMMSRPNGPRVAAMSYFGWDTHRQEDPLAGKLAKNFSGLDAAFGALKSGFGPVWNSTAVLVVTEFGRTVEINGTMGTDHGTATAAFLVGGAVKGGRVLADWPGLRQQELFEGRDLKPTLDLRALFKGVLAEHLGLSRETLEQHVFPDSAAVKPLAGLIRSI